MQILKPEETTRLFEIEADSKRDRTLQLPLIVLSRNKDTEIICSKKQPRTFNGFVADFSKETNITINVIPMKIGYQLDIYTKGMEEADEYVRNFVFNFINYPKLSVNLPYNSTNIEHVANITLEESIMDNSDIKEHLFADEFVRFTLKLYIDDAYLFSMPTSKNVVLEGFGLDVEDRTSHNIIESQEIVI